MKFFIDTANVDEIKKGREIGLVDGVTTNPSLLAREKRDPEATIREILALVPGPVSLEALATQGAEIVEEGRRLASLGDQVVVKIPMTGEGMKAVKILSQEKIRTNVTLVFQPLQALIAAKAGAAYVSPFVGRLDDVSVSGLELVEQIIAIYTNYGFETEIIVASVRNPLHVLRAAMIGADIATIPFNVLKQLMSHPLTDIGIERFMKDYETLRG
jgi:transaldolase